MGQRLKTQRYDYDRRWLVMENMHKKKDRKMSLIVLLIFTRASHRNSTWIRGYNS